MAAHINAGVVHTLDNTPNTRHKHTQHHTKAQAHRKGVIQRPSSSPHTPGSSLGRVEGSGAPLLLPDTSASHTVVGQAAQGGKELSGSSQQMNACTCIEDGVLRSVLRTVLRTSWQCGVWPATQ